jgi:hypothetical protein
MLRFSTCLLPFIAFSTWALPVRAVERPLLAIPLVESAPTIDGQAGPGEWSAAAVTCGFRDIGTGYPARARTTVALCYDQQALYLLYRCYGEAVGKLSGTVGAHDAPVWNDSEVEVFLFPADSLGGKYGHFMVNHAGTQADELDAGTMDSGWNPAWICATSQGADAWSAEIAIPWATLKLNPVAGTVIGANFARNAASVSELSSWAPLACTFHQPKDFGQIRLAGSTAVVALERLPERQTGTTALQPLALGGAQTARAALTITPRLTTRARRPAKAKAQAIASLPATGLPLTIAYGTADLTLEAHGAGHILLWRQSVRLDLPDLPGQIRELRQDLATLQRRSAVTPDAATDLAAALTSLTTDVEKAQAADGVQAIGVRLDTVRCRLSDLDLLSRNRSGGELPYYVTHPVSTLKVQPNSAVPGALAEKLSIAMAKGEFEPVQIVVCPVTRALREVRVSASALTGPGGAFIPAERLVVTPIGSVTCKGSTGGARLSGEIPDVLLPDRAMDVPAGRRQPFLITVQSTADDQPGTYHGTVTVSPADAPATVLPLAVRVYDISLATTSHLRSAFVLWGSYATFMASQAPDAVTAVYINYAKTMLSHRISPITMWAPSKDAQGQWDFSRYDTYCSAVVPLGLTTLNLGGNGEVAGTRNTDFVVAAREHFRGKGWWDMAYIYGWDEAPGSAQDQLVNNYKALVDAVPDIRIMQTGWSPTERLKGLVKIWCPLTAGADLKACHAAQTAGDEVWWYVCCAPTAPYANLFVDYPGIDHRMLGWMTYKYGISGLLYWGVDVWPNNEAPLEQYDQTNYAGWNPNSFGTVMGDGYLLYPGKNDSAVPSLRLALLRDGIEDYDLFKEAEALAASSGRHGKKLRKLLAIGSDLIASLTEFNQDGEALLRHREALLRETEALRRSQRTP